MTTGRINQVTLFIHPKQPRLLHALGLSFGFQSRSSVYKCCHYKTAKEYSPASTRGTQIPCQPSRGCPLQLRKGLEPRAPSVARQFYFCADSRGRASRNNPKWWDLTSAHNKHRPSSRISWFIATHGALIHQNQPCTALVVSTATDC